MDLAVLNNCRRARGAAYQHGDRRGCLRGTREVVLDEIESWTTGFNKSPVFWLNGLAGTGKSTIAQTIAASQSSILHCIFHLDILLLLVIPFHVFFLLSTPPVYALVTQHLADFFAIYLLFQLSMNPHVFLICILDVLVTNVLNKC